ncbi:MAG: 23S rRNA (guanosine(2251)-2'-O)-methyltransferase RlmB [Acidobacteria bacterium]|nr:23S rRNA (guanosine(2251)-2'-O)-methyltransferase RlmB [Acidobacteriota bacterium]
MTMLIYGKNPVRYYIKFFPGDIQEVMTASEPLEKVIPESVNKGIRSRKVGKDFFEKEFRGANHQHIAARVNDYPYADFHLIEARADSVVLLLDGVQDPANLGAILRSGEAMGVDAVIIAKDRAAAVTPAVIRASSGAARGVNVCMVTNITRAIEDLKEIGFWVLAVDMDKDAVPIYKYKMETATAFLLGGEGKGVRRLPKEKTDLIVTVPMPGKVDSMNVSVTAAVILYEAMRQKRSQK